MPDSELFTFATESTVVTHPQFKVVLEASDLSSEPDFSVVDEETGIEYRLPYNIAQVIHNAQPKIGKDLMDSREAYKHDYLDLANNFGLYPDEFSSILRATTYSFVEKDAAQEHDPATLVLKWDPNFSASENKYIDRARDLNSKLARELGAWKVVYYGQSTKPIYVVAWDDVEGMSKTIEDIKDEELCSTLFVLTYPNDATRLYETDAKARAKRALLLKIKKWAEGDILDEATSTRISSPRFSVPDVIKKLESPQVRQTLTSRKWGRNHAVPVFIKPNALGGIRLDLGIELRFIQARNTGGLWAYGPEKLFRAIENETGWKVYNTEKTSEILTRSLSSKEYSDRRPPDRVLMVPPEVVSVLGTDIYLLGGEITHPDKASKDSDKRDKKTWF